MEGKLIIFSAPSGSGKTTIVKKLLSRYKNLEFSISATSRAKREKEKENTDYYFLSADEFRKKIANNEFLEWEEVYKDRFYGTLKSELERIWKKGRHVIFDVDVIGGINIKKQYPHNSLSLFIMPPDLKELENRLVKRNTESKEDIEVRIGKAKEEITYAKEFDKIIINDILENAIEESDYELKNFLNS